MSLSDGQIGGGNRPKNPATKFFEWNGAANGGFVYYFDREAPHPTDPSKKGAKVPYPLKNFVVLDILNAVKGFTRQNDFVWSNEVRNTTTDIMEVSVGNEVKTKGLYQQIKALANGLGGDYVKSVYIAYYDALAKQMVLGNIQMQGAMLGAFIEFCDANAKATQGGAVFFAGTKPGTTGSVNFLSPVFGVNDCPADILELAKGIDREILQPYLATYLATVPNMNTPVPQPVQNQQAQFTPQPSISQPAQQFGMQPNQQFQQQGFAQQQQFGQPQVQTQAPQNDFLGNPQESDLPF